MPLHDYKKARQKFRNKSKFKHPDLELGIAAQYSIIDASMFLPIDIDTQINIFVYQYPDGKKLDIRIWKKKENKFVPSRQGIRIPIELITQLVNRLQWMEKKYGES